MRIGNRDEYVVTIIMAAGKSDKMVSHKSKMVHKIGGKELVRRVVDVAIHIGSDEVFAIVGDLKEQVQNVLKDDVKYVIQEEALGTGNAIMQAEPILKGKSGKVVVLYGDVPLIRAETIKKLIYQNIENDENGTVLTATYNNPMGYGRIIRDEFGNLEKIVEENEATEDERKVKEINSGIYCFSIDELLKTFPKLNNNNSKNEYYLTDVIQIMKDSGFKIGAMTAKDNTETLGVNDKIQLELLNRILKIRTNAYHMKNGVIIEDSNTTYIEDDVEIGIDTLIHSNTVIKSGVKIGENCEIGPNAFIREGCEIADNVKIGNCVELKKAKIEKSSKVPHLTYLGDCQVGENVNIGCGTITCNYDGKNKNRTEIGNNVFVGSNVNFVAPVKVEDNACIGAGSTITEDVPNGNLAIARERQINKIRKKM